MSDSASSCQTFNSDSGSNSASALNLSYTEQNATQLYSRSSFSSQSSSSTSCSPVITKNKRLGFGHLLNPEPIYPSNRDTKSIGKPIHELYKQISTTNFVIDDKHIKKQRTQ
jgi:hypothetical protein